MPTFSIGSVFSSQNVQQGFDKIGRTIRSVGDRFARTQIQVNQVAAALDRVNAAGLNISNLRVQQLRNAAGTGFGSGFGVEGTNLGFRTKTQAQTFLDDMKRTSAAFDNVTSSSKRLERQQDKTAKVNRRQGVSFLQLTGLMIKFGIAMQIITFPEKVISGFM